MQELNDFFNDGFGWVCRHCDNDDATATDRPAASRLMIEGEAESKSPKMTNRALAKWADPARRTLVCPRCGITELAERS
jgi:rubrerythrin